MSMSDPIADMLMCIHNAQAVEKASVVMPSSKLRVAIVKALRDEGYIDEFAVAERGGKPTPMIGLKYHADRPVIECLEHVSKPGLRVYKGRNEIPQAMNGLGIATISTLQGLITDRRAYVTDVGSEVICYAV